jgi:sporulation protein YlmC with PRC-barrel domain
MEHIMDDGRTSKPIPPQALSVSTLLGNQVVDRAGHEVGRIQELMVDPKNGRVTYAVMSFGGIFGVGEKLFAVPWVSLELDSDHDRFVMDVDREKLKDAPGFDKDDWPNMSGTYWGTDVPKFYGRLT